MFMTKSQTKKIDQYMNYDGYHLTRKIDKLTEVSQLWYKRRKILRLYKI